MRLVTILFLYLFIEALAIAQDSTQIKALQEIIIEGKRAVPERMPETEEAGVNMAKKNEVIRLANINANLVNNNSRQIFSRVPGTSVWENDGSGTQIGVSTRGLSPNRSWEFNTRQNGYDISSDIFGYPEAYYSPPMEAVEKIQLLRGGASLQYGSQFGGLLNYTLKRIHDDIPFVFESQNAVGSYGLLSNYTAIGGNTSQINYYAYHHYRKGEAWRENGEYNVRNSHLFFKYKAGMKTSVSAEYTNMNYLIRQPGGLTDAQFKSDPQQSVRSRNWFQVPWNLYALNIDIKQSENLIMKLKVFGLSGERNSIGFLATPNVGDTINASTLQYNNRQIDRDAYHNGGAELKVLYSYPFLQKKQHLALGARAYKANTSRKQRGMGDRGFEFSTNTTNGIFPTDLKFTTSNVAVFAEQVLRLTEKFSITAGLRYEHIDSDISGRLSISSTGDTSLVNGSRSRNFFITGVGMEYKLAGTNVYANLSQAYRPVLFSELTPPTTTDVIDENLKDASGFTADLGYRGSIKEFLAFDLSAFYLHYDNRIGTILKYRNDDPVQNGYMYRTNLGTSINQGIEIYADLNLSKLFHISSTFGDLSLFASSAFIKARYEDFIVTRSTGAAPNLVIIEDNLKNKKVEYAPEQIHNLGLSYTCNKFSATLQTRYCDEVYSDAGNTEASNTGGTAGKIPAYRVFDFSLEYMILSYFNFRFNVNNLTGEKYATRRAGGYPGPGLIPGEGRIFTISIGIKL